MLPRVGTLHYEFLCSVVLYRGIKLLERCVRDHVEERRVKGGEVDNEEQGLSIDTVFS